MTPAPVYAAATSRSGWSASGSVVLPGVQCGDVLNATAPTVGDVKDAGSDLAQPGEDAQKAARRWPTPATAVATAEQELADAQAALATAQASASGTTPSAAPSSKSPSPSPTPASVTRVQEAETEFAAAQAGITDQTPLAQAAEQFNAAAVALEMAWLQLLGDSGCLTDAQQDTAAKAVSSYTTTLQQALADAGYYDAKVDGVYGPRPSRRSRPCRRPTGCRRPGPSTRRPRRRCGPSSPPRVAPRPRRRRHPRQPVQQTLKLAGYWDGPVDGVWTDELTVALEKLQKDLGVKVTGTVDAATIAAVEKAIAELGAPPSPTASTSASPQPTTTG